VVNLMSTKDVEKSSLALLGDPEIRQEVRDLLKNVGTRILNPDPAATGEDWLSAEIASEANSG
jgi:hypothetical protein